MKPAPTAPTWLGVLAFSVLAASCESSERSPANSTGEAADSARAPLYYRSPMDPSVTSPTPAKDAMGMDYVPVYAANAPDEAVQVSPGVIQALGVRTIVVQAAPFQTEVRAGGIVRFDESAIREIRVRTEGFIDDLRVRSVGEVVRRGQLLFQLHSARLEVTEQEFLSSLEFTDAARIELAQQRLLDLGVEQSFIDELRRTRKIPRLVPFHAPRSGIVVSLRVRQGALVSPDAAIMTLASVDPVWVIAQIPPSRASQLNPGDRATLTIDGGAAHSFSGQIDYVYPEADAETRSVPVRISVENPDGDLRANMYASVTLHGGTQTPVLQVPRDSVVRYGGGARVIVALGDGRFAPRLVETGEETDDSVAVLAGLSAGERVVTSAVFLIDAEASIRSGLSRLDATIGTPASSEAQPAGSNVQR